MVWPHVHSQYVSTEGDALFRKGGAEGAATAGEAARATTNGPFVVARGAAVNEAESVGAELFVKDGFAVAVIDILVVPPRELVGLGPGHPVRLGDVEVGGRNETTSDQIDGVVMAQIHGSPPDPDDISGEESAEAGEAVTEEKSLDDSVSGVERREGSEGHWGGGKGCCVHVEAEDLVDTGQTGGRTRHAVSCRRKPMLVLVPRRGTREQELDGNTSDIHPTKGLGERRAAAGSAENEEDTHDHSRESEVEDTIGNPREEIEDRVRVGGENVGKVCSIEDVLQGRENADPDVRTDFRRDKPRIKLDQGKHTAQSRPNCKLPMTRRSNQNIPAAKEVD